MSSKDTIVDGVTRSIPATDVDPLDVPRPLSAAPSRPFMPRRADGSAFSLKTLRNNITAGNLKVSFVGGRIYVSDRQLLAFIHRKDQHPASPGRSEGEKKHAHRRAAALLAADGI